MVRPSWGPAHPETEHGGHVGAEPGGAQGADRPHEGGQAEQEDEPEPSGLVPAAPVEAAGQRQFDDLGLPGAPLGSSRASAGHCSPRALSQLAALVAEARDSQASWTTSVSSLSVSSPIRAARASTER